VQISSKLGGPWPFWPPQWSASVAYHTRQEAEVESSAAHRAIPPHTVFSSDDAMDEDIDPKEARKLVEEMWESMRTATDEAP
jgi:hypothetical protein